MLDIKQTKWVIFDKDLENIWDKDRWIPVEELANMNKHIKYYRGYKAAINGYLCGRGYKEDVENNEIRVLPINLTISIDTSYVEVPASDYFKPKYVDTNNVCRFIKTRRLNAIIDLEDRPNVKFHTYREGGDVYLSVTWMEKDKYGVSQTYYDDVVATSDNYDDLK